MIVVFWQEICGKQLCSVEQLENKLANMRELYNEKMQNAFYSTIKPEEDKDLSDSENLKELSLESIFECQVTKNSFF